MDDSADSGIAYKTDDVEELAGRVDDSVMSEIRRRIDAQARQIDLLKQFQEHQIGINKTLLNVTQQCVRRIDKQDENNDNFKENMANVGTRLLELESKLNTIQKIQQRTGRRRQHFTHIQESGSQDDVFGNGSSTPHQQQAGFSNETHGSGAAATINSRSECLYCKRFLATTYLARHIRLRCKFAPMEQQDSDHPCRRKQSCLFCGKIMAASYVTRHEEKCQEGYVVIEVD